MREIHYNLLQYFPILKGKALCPGSFLPSLLPPGLQHIGITWRALNTINAWVPRSRDYKSWDVTWALGCWTAPWATLMWSQGKKRCSRSRAAGVILLANYLWVPSPVSEGQADADLRRLEGSLLPWEIKEQEAVSQSPKLNRHLIQDNFETLNWLQKWVKYWFGT